MQEVQQSRLCTPVEKQKPNHESDQCPECSADSIVQSNRGDERICKACGLVIVTQNIDYGPEWRVFDQQDQKNKSRVGAPLTQTMHDKGLTTQIDWQNKDGHGNPLSSTKRTQMNRLRNWQARIRTRNAKERNLQFAFSEIDRMASGLGVPDLPREAACVVYRKAHTADLVRGWATEAIASSCLYIACRQDEIPRSLDEIAEVARVSYERVARGHLHLSKELNLKMTPVDPTRYVPRFVSELNASEEVREQACEIIKIAAKESHQSGKSPTGIAAGALYVAGVLCNEKRTQDDIAQVTQVTKRTIRDRYREQIQALKAHGVGPIRRARLREFDY
ncbi:Transcription initiation factor IIB (TFIIB) [Halogranum amylolyticum]|uniref:Transcription initiation factor IIB n=1 Tax=Halogranum amylolyticum TaxID=660520 RepID=A0A1H8VCC1_9EURY|nr:TFIIB-type zinc ribbon-containing protein [Halogranum amylolyticum]SEP12518.1 Transcription initiation factor IIB (TFIIB) [Halogranum amylolyticum]